MVYVYDKKDRQHKHVTAVKYRANWKERYRLAQLLSSQEVLDRQLVKPHYKEIRKMVQKITDVVCGAMVLVVVYATVAIGYTGIIAVCDILGK